MDKKYYLTKEGLNRIKEELNYLIAERKELTKGEVPEALQSEDLNPEYLDFREDLQFLEKRISKLAEITKNAQLIKKPKEKDSIQLGAKVVIEVGGKEDNFVIVESIESDPTEGKISDQSPVGKALVGKKIGDEVMINSKQKIIYKIKDIQY